jgi:hypothetical protein
MPQVIIANRLNDGLVVFLTPEGSWSVSIDEGLVIDAEADSVERLGAAKADEARCLIVDPTLIDVAVEGGRIKPTAIREAIRAFGPTV